MVKSSGILLLPNWNIENALVFNSILGKLNIEDQGNKEIKGVKFSEGHSTLVIWFMRKGSGASSSHLDDTGFIGNLIVKRVEDTPNEEAIELYVGTNNLTLAIALREKKDRLE